MANSRVSEERAEWAIINTAPGAEGYWTVPFTAYNKRTERKAGDLYFTIMETAVGSSESGAFSMTVSLQYRAKISGSWTEWQTYDTYTSVTKKIVDDYSASFQYRIGIASGNYTGGEVTLGFNW